MVTRYKHLQREVKELSLLFEISQTLNRSKNIKEIVRPVLKVVAEHMGLSRAALTILNRTTNEIFIEDAYGLSVEERARGRYKVGEGITGKVVASGRPMIIPKISEEPQFLDRTEARKNLNKSDISFICVPIKLSGEVIGAFSVDRLFDDSFSLEDDVRLLSIIASMIAQSVRVYQSLQEERLYLQEENQRLQNEVKDVFRPANIIGNAKRMKEMYALIERVSSTDTTVFIYGESGVGKELVAAAIHYNSNRADKPFIKVNCAAFPDSLVESELFGHEKGSFTGAVATRKGRFESANGGTLLLDEIGDLSLVTQVKLLRVLQEKEFERIGSNTTIKTDVRIIAATNRDIEELISKRLFRQDLFYRLNVFPIHVPPLRQRKSDIMLLADHFVEKYSKKLGHRVKRITTSAIDMMMSYHWPGNVRELENAMERAVLLSTDGVIHAYHMPPSLQTAETSGTVCRSTLATILSNVERDLIIDALKSTKGNMSKATKILGISERIMGLRVKKYGINPKNYRD
ncbi:MAG: GAF domain-containing protein [FCB group bacterium]|nr:GAF domain-containing protein [FCB group bacterium]